MANIQNLPYLQNKNTFKTSYLARFLLKKIKKYLLKNSPYHYLIFHRQDKLLKFIQKTSKKYHYFLRFDIEKFYPSINHSILIELLIKKLDSRNGKKILKQEIIPFLKENNIQNKGLVLGNYLSWVLAGVYLLPLDEKLILKNKPFLRVQDDYLIFCKNKKEPLKILKEIIEPTLNQLELKININKLNSGKFHQNPMEFMGFRYYGGVFTISENKIEEFKNKIIKITHLTKKKPIEAIIKQLNNQILGFGHYYKFSQCKQIFIDLDAFIRQRLRRYLCRNKDSQNKLGNLTFTNEQLKSLGLKSLVDIYQKYRHKKTLIFKKSEKKKVKNEQIFNQLLTRKIPDNIDKYYILGIYKSLKEITKNIAKIERKIQKIEVKLEKIIKNISGMTCDVEH